MGGKVVLPLLQRCRPCPLLKADSGSGRVLVHLFLIMFSQAIAEYILLARKKKQLMQAKPKRKGRVHGASSLENDDQIMVKYSGCAS